MDEHLRRGPRLTLALWHGRLYVVYDQAENPNATSPEDADLQTYVKVYELTQQP